MADYDGLPLNTPTKIRTIAGDYEVWATRTANGGTVENRIIANGPSDLTAQREARITAAIPVLRQWAIDGRATTVTSGNAVATLQTTINHLATFFDNFADLLQSMGR